MRQARAQAEPAPWFDLKKNRLRNAGSPLSPLSCKRGEVEVLPMKSMQGEMSTGIAYYEGEIYNVLRHGRNNPPVPLLIMGIFLFRINQTFAHINVSELRGDRE